MADVCPRASQARCGGRSSSGGLPPERLQQRDAKVDMGAGILQKLFPYDEKTLETCSECRTQSLTAKTPSKCHVPDNRFQGVDYDYHVPDCVMLVSDAHTLTRSVFRMS